MKTIQTTHWKYSATCLFVWVLLSLSASIHTQAQQPENLFFSLDGPIYDMVVEGNDLYIGGAFTSAGTKVGNLALFNHLQNKPNMNFPFIGDPSNNGTRTDYVADIIPDEKGGWFLCGNFTKVGEEKIRYVAHIDANNQVDKYFSFPEIEAEAYGMPQKLLQHNGYLYVAGGIKTLHGHLGVCRIDISSRKLDTQWKPKVKFWNSNGVTDLVAHKNRLFLANTASINDQSAVLIGCVDLLSGERVDGNWSAADANQGTPALAVIADTLYIGANQSQSYPQSWGRYFGHGTIFDLSSNIPLSTGLGLFASVLSDQKGGWYAAGSFTQIQGHQTIGLVHFKADQKVDTEFAQPLNNGYNSAGTLVGLDQNYVYVKGFLHGPTQKTYQVARFERKTGSFDADWFYNINTNCEAFVNDTSVVIYGGFTQIDNTSVKNVAILSTQNHKITSLNSQVQSVPNKVSGNNKHIYIETNAENKIIRIDSKGTIDPEFNLIRSSSSASNLMFVNDSLLVVFAQYSNYSLNGGPQAARCFFDIRSNTFHPIHQKFNSIKRSFNYYGEGTTTIGLIDKQLIYSNTNLDSINGKYQPYIFSMNTETGLVTNFNPRPNNPINNFTIGGNQFMIVNSWATTFETIKSNLLGFNLNTLDPITNLPQPNGPIYRLNKHNNTLILSGAFTRLAERTTNNIALLNTENRSIETMELPMSGAMWDFSISGATQIDNILYFTGRFETVAGKARSGFAAYNLSTKELTDWDPKFNNDSRFGHKIVSQNNSILVNGPFTLTQFRKVAPLIKVNLQSEEIYDWGPEQFNDGGYAYVGQLKLDGDILYAGGYFNKVNASSVQNLAAFDKENGGLIESFKPQVSGNTYFILVEDDALIVTGNFTSVNGQNRFRAAKIDKNTGELLPFEFNLSNNASSYIESVAKLDDGYLIAGKFLHQPNSSQNKNFQLARVDGSTGNIVSQFEIANKNSASRLVRRDSLVFFTTNSNSITGEPYHSILSYSIEKDTIRDWSPAFAGNINAMLFNQSRLFITGGNINERVTNAWGGTNFEAKDYTILAVTDINNDTIFSQIPLLMGDKTKGVSQMIEWNNRLLIGGSFYKMGTNVQAGGIAQISLPNNLFQPELTNFSPRKIGNKGTTRYTIYGKGFKSGTQVNFKKGTNTIEPKTIHFEGDTKIYGELELENIEPGLYDLNVAIPGDTTMKLPQALTIEQADQPEIWVNLSGPDQVTRGKPTSFYLNIGNNGNVNAYMVPVMVITEEMPLEMKSDWFDQNQGNAVDQIPTTLVADASYGESKTKYILFFIVPVVSANSSGVLKLQITNGNSEDKSIEVYSFSPMYEEMGAQFKSTAEVEGFFYNLFKCAYNFIPSPPGWDCAKSVFDNYCFSMFDRWMNDEHRQPLPKASFAKATGTVILDCATDLFPAAKVGKMVHGMYKVTKDAVAAEGKFDACTGVGKSLVKELQDMVSPVWSQDPNDKYGPLGINGSHFVRSDRPWSFTIMYENVDSALVAAQKVTIIDTIDINKFDISTFELVSAGFSDTSIVYDGNRKTSIDHIDLRPTKNTIVRIENSLDTLTGIAEWTFLALDPKTMELTEDANGGFLPPNKTAPEGEGFVLFNIWPKTNIDTGDTLTNTAMIVFDWNEPIFTPEYYAHIDNVRPQSQVLQLPFEATDTTFNVEWTGQDEGSGIAWYDVFVSKDDEPYTLWLGQTSTTNALFTGQQKSTYAFYSVATDSAKNVEIAPTTYDTQITIPDLGLGSNSIDINQLQLWAYVLKSQKELMIHYTIPADGNIQLELFNLKGQKMKTIENCDQRQGQYQFLIATNDLLKGVYLLRLTQNNDIQIETKIQIQ